MYQAMPAMSVLTASAAEGLANAMIQMPPTTMPSGAQPRSEDEKRQWSYQYYGYPALLEWMASSHDTFILRRFTKSCGRCLMRRQHEIAKLEQELEKIDTFLQEQPAGYGSSDSFDDDVSTRRPKIINELEDHLLRYCEKSSNRHVIVTFDY